MTNCPLCKKELRTYVQPALVPGRAGYTLADCTTPCCPLYRVTLVAGAHEKLTTVEIGAYKAAQVIDP